MIENFGAINNMVSLKEQPLLSNGYQSSENKVYRSSSNSKY